MSEHFPRIEQRENGKAVVLLPGDDSKPQEIDLDHWGEKESGLPMSLSMTLTGMARQGISIDSPQAERLIADFGAAMLARGLVFEKWMGSK